MVFISEDLEVYEQKITLPDTCRGSTGTFICVQVPLPLSSVTRGYDMIWSKATPLFPFFCFVLFIWVLKKETKLSVFLLCKILNLKIQAVATVSVLRMTRGKENSDS